MTSVAHRGFVHLGMDVSKNSISVAVLPPDRDVAQIDKIEAADVAGVADDDGGADCANADDVDHRGLRRGDGVGEPFV